MMHTEGSSGSQVAEAYEQKSVESTFKSAAVSYKNQLLISLTPQQLQNPDFSSFENASIETQELGPVIWQAEEANNPNFSDDIENGSTNMFAALKTYFGHGILVSVILANGDTATWEINPLDPNAIIYVKGTARDRNNKPLPDYTPNVDGGGSGTVSVQPSQPGADPAEGTYYIGGNESIVCGFVDGVVSVCTVTENAQ